MLYTTCELEFDSCQCLSNLFTVGDRIIDNHPCSANTYFRIHADRSAKKLSPWNPKLCRCAPCRWFAGWGWSRVPRAYHGLHKFVSSLGQVPQTLRTTRDLEQIHREILLR
jgi:hypothetical protein